MRTSRRTEIVVTLTAEEVGNLLVPAVQEKVATDKVGKLVSAKSKDLGGLAVEVTMTFENSE